MTKLDRRNGWTKGHHWGKDLQQTVDQYIERAKKRGYNFVVIWKWNTGHYFRWDRVRLLDTTTGRVRNMFFNNGWKTTTARAKEKFIPLDIAQDIVKFVATGHLYSGRPAIARAKRKESNEL